MKNIVDREKLLLPFFLFHFPASLSPNGPVLWSLVRSERRRNFQIFPDRRPINSRSWKIFPIANRQSAHLVDLLRGDNSLAREGNSASSSERLDLNFTVDKINRDSLNFPPSFRTSSKRDKNKIKEKVELKAFCIIR